MSTVAELARRQNALREVNERINELAWAQTPLEERGYVCECSQVGCAETVALVADAYEAVRASAVRFVLTPGHEHDEVEQVVERAPTYVIVENVGEAAEVARLADPRAPEPAADARVEGDRCRERGRMNA